MSTDANDKKRDLALDGFGGSFITMYDNEEEDQSQIDSKAMETKYISDDKITSKHDDSDTETLQGDVNIADEHEGGGLQAWLVVAATFLVLVVGLGAGTGWGVMQNYFEQYEGFAGIQNLSFKLTFVATICNILMNLLAPVGQLLLTLMQARTVLFLSILFCSAGLLLASFSTQVWHLYLTHGFIYGIGSSIMYYIALSVVPLWFVKNRGVALGVISSGISIGGLVMPLIMEPLNTKLGASWCYRIMSLICLVIGIFACVLLKNKSKPTLDDDANSGNEVDKEKAQIKDDSSKLNLKKMFDFTILKNWRFLLWCVVDILLEGAYNVPYYFLPSYATHLGLTSSQGAVILSVGSGMNALGRIISGSLADYIGHVNVIIIYSIISGLANLILWSYANTFGMLMAFSVVFGFFGGAFITLTPTITLLTTGQEKFESGLSVFLVITVVSMFGPNLADAIESTTGGSQPFDSYKFFTGACYLFGSLLLILFKLSLDRNPLVKI